MMDQFLWVLFPISFLQSLSVDIFLDTAMINLDGHQKSSELLEKKMLRIGSLFPLWDRIP